MLVLSSRLQSKTHTVTLTRIAEYHPARSTINATSSFDGFVPNSRTAR